MKVVVTKSIYTENEVFDGAEAVVKDLDTVAEQVNENELIENYLMNLLLISTGVRWTDLSPLAQLQSFA